MREDSSSNNNTDSYGEDGIYDDAESWGYKALTLGQIIGGKSGGMFPINRLTLHAYSWHWYARICKNPTAEPKADFYQAKE